MFLLLKENELLHLTVLYFTYTNHSYELIFKHGKPLVPHNNFIFLKFNKKDHMKNDSAKYCFYN